MQTVLTHNSELAVLPVLWLHCFICRRQKQAPGKAEGMLLPFSCSHPLACLMFVFLGGAAKTNMLWGVAARVALAQPLAQGVPLSRAGRRWHAGCSATWHLAQAVLHITFCWLAVFNGCSLGIPKNTCSIEKS